MHIHRLIRRFLNSNANTSGHPCHTRTNTPTPTHDRPTLDGNFTHSDGRSRSCSRSTSMSEERIGVAISIQTPTRWWAGDGYKFDNLDLGIRLGHGACAILPGLSWRVDGGEHSLYELSCLFRCFLDILCMFMYTRNSTCTRTFFSLPSLSFAFRTACPLIRFISLAVLHWLPQSHNQVHWNQSQSWIVCSTTS